MSIEPMRATVVSRVSLSPSMIRVVLGGGELQHFESSSVPDEFIWLSFTKPDGTMSGRYYTVRQWNKDARHLTVDFVKHESGIGTEWAQQASVGDSIEIYLPRSRFDPPAQGSILLVGDYSALPAIARIVEELPLGRTLIAHVEIPEVADRIDLGMRENIAIHWHETFGKGDKRTRLSEIARMATLPDQLGYVWIAGEAKVVAECRRHFRNTCGIAKESITAVGYWVEGQARG
ncbi:siderophore-interacting protein [Agrobacterium sp. Ap1]|jgi:NADPH-dependent ferric siderophore reductase|uniref:siderophore-interacting protein n=1 Tax=Agrobacterium sp. Ap1 TaxID=2815337 RepID=UPI001A8F8AD1|nr:siderophore-interacting protein [Agrobacterium sp. Ap1]MBO0144525.1 siderophore-interacting protein [Agrobacterium sp. Ap1]